MDMQRISYTELAQISKELKTLALEIKNEIHNINTVVSNLENNPGIKSIIGNVSIVDNVNKITSNFNNYNNIIAKFSKFLDEEVIKGTQKMQDEINMAFKKWEASIEKENDDFYNNQNTQSNIDNIY